MWNGLRNVSCDEIFESVRHKNIYVPARLQYLAWPLTAVITDELNTNSDISVTGTEHKL